MGLVAALAGLAAAAVLRLRPDASLEGLFPRDSASGAAVVRVLNDFAVAEELLVLVSAPESSTTAAPESLLAFAARLDRAIRSDPNLKEMAADVAYRAEPQTRQFFERVVVPAGLYYLDDRTVAESRRPCRKRRG